MLVQREYDIGEETTLKVKLHSNEVAVAIFYSNVRVGGGSSSMESRGTYMAIESALNEARNDVSTTARRALHDEMDELVEKRITNSSVDVEKAAKLAKEESE